MSQVLERLPAGGARASAGRSIRRSRVARPSVAVAVDAAGATLAAALILPGIAVAAVPFTWMILLALAGCYAPAVLPVGAALRTPCQAALAMVVVIEIVALTVWPGDRTRLLLLSWMAASLAWSLAVRVVGWARWHLRRLRGRCPARRAVVVGGSEDVRRVLGDLTATPLAGVEVVAVCVPEPSAETWPTATVLGYDDLPAAVTEFGAEVALAVPCRELTPAELRRLAWRLEPTGTELLVAPGLPDVSPRRTRMAVTGSVPLLHVRRAQLHGGRRVVKEVAERLLALAVLAAAAPLLAMLILLLRLESPGPAVFRQVRVGRDERPFTLYKLRTMVVDADRRRDELVNEADGLLFKVHDDPRITRVGRILRRYSFDELPQLWNVVRGDMALVGPRPPLPAEVAAYDDDVRRRLAVKPGITGLWQVSGRSDLPWTRAVQLDLHYVDNWSLGLDLAIAVRTVRAVLSHTGAY